MIISSSTLTLIVMKNTGQDISNVMKNTGQDISNVMKNTGQDISNVLKSSFKTQTCTILVLIGTS